MVRQATEIEPARVHTRTLRDFNGVLTQTLSTQAGDVDVLFFGPFPSGTSIDFCDFFLSAPELSTAVTIHVGTFLSPVSDTAFLTSITKHLIIGLDTGSPSLGMPVQVVSTLGSISGAGRWNFHHRMEGGIPYLGIRMSSAAEDCFACFSLGAIFGGGG